VREGHSYFQGWPGRQINECVWKDFNVFVSTGEGETVEDRGCSRGVEST
jgi:hypothetical protein